MNFSIHYQNLQSMFYRFYLMLSFGAASKSGKVTTVSVDGTQIATINDGDDGLPGAPGSKGDDGTTYTPAVSSAGVISWTNDGGKVNPQSVDLVAAVLAALPVWGGGSY